MRKARRSRRRDPGADSVRLATRAQEILTMHKAPVAEFIEEHYDPFFEQYTGLLKSANYVTRRLSLKVGSLNLRPYNPSGPPPNSLRTPS
eukprot:1177876-Prorocentrum_minimum.AAC.1